MKHPLRAGAGWRPAVRFRGALLLNGPAHKPQGGPALPRCPVCKAALTFGHHAVHHEGEILHPDCLLYRRARA